MMGNANQFEDPKGEPQSGQLSNDVDRASEPQGSEGKVTDGGESAGSDDGTADGPVRSAEHSAPSLPPSEDRPLTRRSSLRPAPPSFRPSTRHPSQLLRPAMVVHAGDVDADIPLWDVSEPAPSHPSQAAVDSPRPEPFALANDFSPLDPHQAPSPAVAQAASVPASESKNPTREGSSAAATGAMASAPAVPATSATSRHAGPRSTGVSRPARNTLSHFGAPNRQSRPPVVPAGLAASSQTAGADSGPNLGNAQRRLSNSHAPAIVAAIVLAGVVVVMMLGRTNTYGTNEAASVTARSEQVLPSAPIAVPTPPVADSIAVPTPPVADSIAVPTPPVADSIAAPVASLDPEAKAAPSPETDTARESGSAPANSTRVTLEIVPMDARVIHQGRLQPPPYVFDVPKGKRLSLELVRFGFVTQKVVLDGKRPVVKIGLRRAPNTRGAAAN